MSISKALFIIRYLLFIILLGGKGFAAVNAPSMRCLNVNSINGDVTIGWVIPADPANEFFSYQIFSSVNKNGPFSPIGTVNIYTQNSFTDAGTSANAAPVYYFMETHYGPAGSGVSAHSDTLQTIFLKGSLPIDKAVVSLNWNSLHKPKLPSSAAKYYIYKQFPPATWTLLDSTDQLTYQYINNGICDSTRINYRIELKDASGCNSVSSVFGQIFIDNNQPTRPKIRQVSTDIVTGKASISWYNSPSPDVVKYKIYKIDKFNNFVLIDSVNVPALSYTYLPSKADSASEGYSIASTDGCNNTSAYVDLAHYSIFVKDTIDICAKQVKIKWNKYINWEQGVNAYEVYRSDNGGAYLLLQTLASTDSTYTDSNLSPFYTYTYYIKAIEKNGLGISTSNVTKPVYFRIPKPPLFLDIESAGVNLADQSITIVSNIDTTAGTKFYKILRSVDNITYSVIATLPAIFAAQLSYTDNTVNTAETSYYYRVTATDSCGEDYKTSAYVRTMLLNVTGNTDLTSILTWNDYEGFSGNINIYRGINRVWNPLPVATVSYGVNTYTDDISGILAGNGDFCYYVEAVNGSKSSITSKSNISCEAQKPILFVPNAFSPNGDALNDVFKPRSAFIGTKDYALIIYNRWGKPIYESHDPQIGWDGSTNGEQAQVGVYAYIIRYTATNGDSFEKKGSFTLIR